MIILPVLQGHETSPQVEGWLLQGWVASCSLNGYLMGDWLEEAPLPPAMPSCQSAVNDKDINIYTRYLLIYSVKTK